jgi:hypothetical protein
MKIKIYRTNKRKPLKIQMAGHMGFRILLSMQHILQNYYHKSKTNDASCFSKRSGHAFNKSHAFTIKGIYYNKKVMSFEYKALIKLLANRLVQMYKHSQNCCSGLKAI